MGSTLLDEFCNSYGKWFRYARSMAHSDEDAEDVLTGAVEYCLQSHVKHVALALNKAIRIEVLRMYHFHRRFLVSTDFQEVDEYEGLLDRGDGLLEDRPTERIAFDHLELKAKGIMDDKGRMVGLGKVLVNGSWRYLEFE